VGREGKVSMYSLGGVEEAGGRGWERIVDPYSRYLFVHLLTHKPSHTLTAVSIP